MASSTEALASLCSLWMTEVSCSAASAEGFFMVL